MKGKHDVILPGAVLRLADSDHGKNLAVPKVKISDYIALINAAVSNCLNPVLMF